LRQLLCVAFVLCCPMLRYITISPAVEAIFIWAMTFDSCSFPHSLQELRVQRHVNPAVQEPSLLVSWALPLRESSATHYSTKIIMLGQILLKITPRTPLRTRAFLYGHIKIIKQMEEVFFNGFLGRSLRLEEQLIFWLMGIV